MSLQFLDRATCEALRNAGYPQDKTTFGWLLYKGKWYIEFARDASTAALACPLEGEIIAELGEDFEQLYYTTEDGVRVYLALMDNDKMCKIVSGVTPIQALAALWLAVHGKGETRNEP